MNEWGIPSLRADRLSTLVPIQTYAGNPVSDSAHTLFIWRTASLSKARGMVLGFYVWDDRLEALWRNPEHSTARLLRAGVIAVIEPDFSLWTDEALIQQAYNVFRMRTLGRRYQEAGIPVIPNLAWSDERSFAFCFSGIPVGAPVCMTECRTPGGNDADRRAFLAGLTQAVNKVQPQHVVIYGGKEHAYWLTEHLPHGPQYTLIDSWTTERRRVRAAQERQARERHQLSLFAGGNQWAEEAQVAA